MTWWHRCWIYTYIARWLKIENFINYLLSSNTCKLYPGQNKYCPAGCCYFVFCQCTCLFVCNPYEYCSVHYCLNLIRNLVLNLSLKNCLFNELIGQQLYCSFIVSKPWDVYLPISFFSWITLWTSYLLIFSWEYVALFTVPIEQIPI